MSGETRTYGNPSETGFGETGFGEIGFGEVGFGEIGFGKMLGHHIYTTTPHNLPFTNAFT